MTQRIELEGPLSVVIERVGSAMDDKISLGKVDLSELVIRGLKERHRWRRSSEYQVHELGWYRIILEPVGEVQPSMNGPQRTCSVCGGDPMHYAHDMTC